MPILNRWGRIAAVAVWVTVTVGCQTTGQTEQPNWTPVQVTDATRVAGKWEGIMRRMPPTPKDDWLTAIIAPDGKYRFSSVRTIGVFRDEGNLVAADGRLTTSSDRGSIDVALYEAGERRMLKVKGHTPRGEEYFADLTPVK
jgi:hypothetical protein